MKNLVGFYFKGLYYFFTNSYFRSFTFKFVFFSLFKGGNTIKVNGRYIQTYDFKSCLWQYYEIFFQSYYKFELEHSTNEMNIIDCGSNVGMSILFYQTFYPKSQIHAFEPSKLIYKLLVSNIKNQNNIFFHNKAVWINNEEIAFIDNGADSSHISMSDSEKTSKIQAIDLSLFLDKFETIHFLKLDIEGAENIVIPHIAKQLHKINYIFIEYHSYHGKSQKLSEILSILEKHNFRYDLRVTNKKVNPFKFTVNEYEMDLQVNIFAKQF